MCQLFSPSACFSSSMLPSTNFIILQSYSNMPAGSTCWYDLFVGYFYFEIVLSFCYIFCSSLVLSVCSLVSFLFYVPSFVDHTLSIARFVGCFRFMISYEVFYFISMLPSFSFFLFAIGASLLLLGLLSFYSSCIGCPPYPFLPPIG